MSPRKLIRWLGNTLRRPGVLISLGLIALALLIWFLGPLIAFGDFQPLGPVSVRLACLLFIALLWGIGSLFFRTVRSSEETSMLAALRKQQEETEVAEEKEGAALDAEISAFREAVRTVVQFLRKGRGSLFVSARYSLPWYVVLGNDSAGKTSVVRASGLALPFETASPSVAGTVHFHITDRAVFAEFPGAFLTQPERRLALLWQRMLDYIKRQRAQQPINGILVVTSTEELLAMQEEQITDYAAAIRKRLDETITRLRTVAPVYLLVNKLDLVVGFEEFFESLTAEERTSVLGVPLSALRSVDGASASGSFANGFSSIIERFSQQQFLRMQEEPDELRRRRIFEFTGQFALLQARLEPLLQHLASTHRFGQAPNIRGLFFTSTNQSGEFSDLLGQSLSTSFGQRRGGLALPQDVGVRRTRPFFLTGLFRDVIIPEANLSGLTKPALLVTRLQDVAANIVLFITLLVLLGIWWLGFSEGRAYTARIDEHVTVTHANITEATPDGKIPTKFEPVLNVLDRLRTLSQEVPRSTTFGLYTTGSVRQASSEAYDRALANLFFPFVWAYLRDGLDNPATPAALRFQQLKFYLMLTGTRPTDQETAALISPDFAANWLTYERNADIDRRISAHFAALAGTTVTAPPADLALVDRARRRIADYTLARLAYDNVLAVSEVQQLPIWRPVDHMGLQGPQALARANNGSLWDGIPGIYTRNGLKDVMLGTANRVARRIADDLWAMGTADNLVEQEREAARIRDGLLDLYRVDYITQWDTLLSDLSLGGGTAASEVARSMAIITGNPSPVKELVTAIAAETDLEAASTTVLDAIPGAAAKSAQVNTALQPRRVVNVAKTIAEHYKSFRNAVTAPEGQQAPVDAMLVAMQPLYRMLNHVATGNDVLELGAEPQTLLNQLSERNGELPASLQPLFARIMAQVAAITGGSSRERLSQIWKTTVLPLCEATTTARYPFDPNSINDTSLEDFARLFGPKGAIAGFRENYLKPFIDSSTRPWRWKTGQQIGLGYDDKILAELEKADNVTTIYFGEQEKPSVQFTITPGKLDMRARAFVLDIGGPALLYNHGPPVDTQYQWPSENISVGANISMMPELEGERNIVSRQGAWALFRLLKLGRMLEKSPTDIVTYQFRVGSRQVLLRLAAPPTRNPFARDILADYSCPVL
ncbi:type VI secretion system membrane subunit TssM [Rhizobium sp. LjRoot30]|uniref:type VI secretion system membrane subunit TssM n=1 Tax=Rhizobium sp. LjRoot30 TaxID=3342320 RepID=UPI003ECCED90